MRAPAEQHAYGKTTGGEFDLSLIFSAFRKIFGFSSGIPFGRRR
jgi:hypothetical protein